MEESKSSTLENRIEILAQWMFEANHLVVFTGAGISTESGLPDFRGPDGLWTRQVKGLPAPRFDWSQAEPNESHLTIAELQNMGKPLILFKKYFSQSSWEPASGYSTALNWSGRQGMKVCSKTTTRHSAMAESRCSSASAC